MKINQKKLVEGVDKTKKSGILYSYSEGIMDQVVLKGKTSKGKNRIAQHGAVWEVVDCRPFVQRLGHGTWLLVESKKDGNCRWISLTDDPDFAILNEA